MKSITYMMQYLTSILSPSNSKQSESNQEKLRIEDLEARILNLEIQNEEITLCIQHLANTLTTMLTHVASQSSDPYEEIIKKSGNDGNGSGFLH